MFMSIKKLKRNLIEIRSGLCSAVIFKEGDTWRLAGIGGNAKGLSEMAQFLFVQYGVR